MDFVLRITRAIETKQIGVVPFFSSLMAIIIVRNFLENILDATHSVGLATNFYLQVTDYCHITLSWITVFLTFVLILRLFSGRSLAGVAKAVLAFFPVIILVPLLDFFIFGSGTITYQNNFDSFWSSYLYLFDPRARISYVTIGVRIEIFIAVLFSFIYLLSTTVSYVRAGTGALSIYSAIYFFGYFPAIYNWLFSTTLASIINSSILASRSPIQFNFLIYLPVTVFLCFCIYCLLEKRMRRGLWVSLRVERFTIYFAIMLFGVAVAAVNGMVFEEIFNIYDLLKIASAAISLACAFVYSVILNDICDYSIDLISNPDRPLVKGDIAPQLFADIKSIMLILSVFFAVPVNEYFFLILIFILSLSYLYSTEPFRLKRFFVVSNVLLALIGTSVFLLGTCLVDGVLAFSNADRKLLGLIFIFFFIASHLKDVKDTEGDRKNGIVTLPTLVGSNWAYGLISAFVFFTILACGYLLALNIALIICNLLIFSFFSILLKNSERLLLALQCCIATLFIGYGYMFVA